MSIFDLVQSQELAAYWIELSQDEAPYMGEELFPDDKKLGLDLKKSNNNISTLINANNQQQLTQTNNNELSNTSSVIKNTLTKFNITVDKLRLRKEIMIQEKITNQSSSFKIFPSIS